MVIEVKYMESNRMNFRANKRFGLKRIYFYGKLENVKGRRWYSFYFRANRLKFPRGVFSLCFGIVLR